MDLRVQDDRVAHASRLLISGGAPKQSFFDFRQQRRRANLKKFATARTRSPARETRALPRTIEAQSYSPAPRCRAARAYSRFSLAIKLALISAGQTASHS